MAADGSSITEYDWLTESILKELRSMEGEGTTTELRERIGAEQNDSIRYRLSDKLEPQGFVETEQPTGGPGPSPAKIARLTSRGEGLADQLLDAGDPDDLSISTEIEQLRAEVNKLESKVKSQAEIIEELVQGHDDMVGWVEAIEDDLDSR